MDGMAYLAAVQSACIEKRLPPSPTKHTACLPVARPIPTPSGMAQPKPPPRGEKWTFRKPRRTAMSCTIASSEEPSVMTWVARSRWRNTPNIRASLGRLPDGGYFASSAATSAVRLRRNRRRAQLGCNRIQRCLYFAEHGDIAGIVEPKLTGRGRDLNDLQVARHRGTAIVGEGIDLFADQQHRVVAAQSFVDFLRGRRKLTAKVRMQRIDRALHMKRRGVDIGVEHGRNPAQGIEAVGGADRIVCDDGQLLGRNRLEGVCHVTDRARHGVLDDLRLLESRVCGSLQHEVHRDRKENRSSGLEPRLQVAAL